jgi:hypothetical protein
MTSERQAFAAEEIRYGVRATATGLAAIAVSGRGVVAVLLGMERVDLRAQLAHALSGATLVAEDRSIDPTLDAVVRYLDVPSEAPGFDVDLRGDDRDGPISTRLLCLRAWCRGPSWRRSGTPELQFLLWNRGWRGLVVSRRGHRGRRRRPSILQAKVECSWPAQTDVLVLKVAVNCQSRR